jgi:hypothetical protein
VNCYPNRRGRSYGKRSVPVGPILAALVPKSAADS